MEKIKLIDDIDFHDNKVNIYYHPDKKDELNNAEGVWQMRNPDSCYNGVVFVNYKTGKFAYPDGAVIPEQTDEDRIILPKFIIVGKQELDDDLVKSIKIYLESNFLRKNEK